MARIELSNLSLEFPIYEAGKRVLKRELIRLATGGKLKSGAQERVVMVRALSNLSLTIPHGMRLGLIGHNGAGKTSLLRVLAGIYEPTEGSLSIEGEVTPLLDMMIGFDEASTGYEVITIRGLLQGLSLTEVRKREQAIADFTELGDYLEMPIRTYSAGMKMRLAFGVAAATSPEILVLDEVFGVGDASFLEKAKRRMREMVECSNIVLFTSHNLELIEEICSHVLWLEAGEVRFFGPSAAGIKAYLSHTLSDGK